MKKTIGIVAASALAIAAFSAPAAAYNDNACFGQLHKSINTDAATQAFVEGLTGQPTSNVGDLVGALPNKGQDKKAVGRSLAC